MLQQNLTTRSRDRIVGLALLLSVWCAFAAWQRSEYAHQSRLIQDSLSSQAEALSSAVGSSLQSHRWFGPFVQQQLPDTLAVLARSSNVLSIAIVVNDNAHEAYLAGDRTQVDFELSDGRHAVGNTLQFVDQFEVPNTPPMRRVDYAAGGFVGDRSTSTDTIKSFVVLDRTGTIAQIRREARNRIFVFALGTFLLIAAAAVWQFTVRLAKSEGTTKVLQAETRHLRELGQAAAGLAHETRNPLGLIRGWTQRLADAGLPDPEQQEQAEAVLEECDRVTARINQFLAFARQAEVKVDSVDPAQLLQELQSLLQSDLDSHSLTLTRLGFDQPGSILADRDQFRQVLFNLLQNAIAFAPPNSAIQVSMRRSNGETYRMEIADEGPGVSDEIAESLFEPYVTRRPGGTGLGLSIVRRIAVAHHWDVGYLPGADGGSVIWIDGIHSA